eukprot:PhM_4_TR14750/c0_g1_i1/m.76892
MPPPTLNRSKLALGSSSPPLSPRIAGPSAVERVKELEATLKERDAEIAQLNARHEKELAALETSIRAEYCGAAKPQYLCRRCRLDASARETATDVFRAMNIPSSPSPNNSAGRSITPPAMTMMMNMSRARSHPNEHVNNTFNDSDCVLSSPGFKALTSRYNGNDVLTTNLSLTSSLSTAMASAREHGYMSSVYHGRRYM